MTHGEPSAKAARPFTVMAKPVGARCNLRCSYCYYSNQTAPGLTGAQPVMADEVLELFISQYIEASAGPIVSFVWHGGEPLLAGVDFYRKAVNLQKKLLPVGWSCWNNIQTNGVLLDDEWCSFLAEAGFDIGLSIDGTSLVHDTYRKDAAGVGTHHFAQAAIRRLQAHGIQPDLLCTVTPAAVEDPLGVYRALRGYGTGWIQFIPIVEADSDGRITPDSVTPTGYGEFLCAVFDEWVLHDLDRLGVQMFAETMRILSGGSAGLCWMAPVCGRALIVENDGGVYSCDHFVNSDYRIGDIFSAHLRDLADSPEQTRFGENKRDMLPAKCPACEWLAVCGGGCPKDRFAYSDADDSPNNRRVAPFSGDKPLNYLCGGLSRFFSYTKPAFEFIEKLTKAGQPPDVIMVRLRDSLKNVWKDVGRNDPCPCGSGRKAKHCCWDKRV